MRRSKVFQSDRNNRTVKDVRQERDLGYGRVHGIGGSPDMHIYWKMNREAAQDQVIKIQLGKETTYVYWEQLLRFGRWV